MTQVGMLFLRQFVRSPRSIGAVWPSSPALARAMLSAVDFSSARTIVEFGPGTGAFTREIAGRLAPGARYLGIELNPVFVTRLAHSYPRLSFVHGSVGELGQILVTARITSVDAIVCGLPWATLPISLQDTVFSAIDLALAPGGVFTTFGYPQSLVLPGAWALRRRLRRGFAEVGRTPVVWGNVPPAFAYICRKRS
jgi:phosphatidylethanolamine/phosphatidyl-N-methylethanolamine N-methyltransferase